MEDLKFKSSNDIKLKDKLRIYYCAYKNDYFKYLDEVVNDILSVKDCIIYYLESAEDNDFDSLERQAELKQMQLFVVPVTFELLNNSSIALDKEIAFAISNHIPILPLMQQGNLDALFTKKFGDIQYLYKGNNDKTAISFAKKLESFLESVELPNDAVKLIKNEFTHEIFLSYRKKDRIYALELMKLIHSNEKCRDVAIWYDEFIVPGENFNKNIEDELLTADLFTLLVTPNIINEKNYVQDIEYPMAIKNNKDILSVEFVETDKQELEKQFEKIKIIDIKDITKFNEELIIALKNGDEKLNEDPRHKFYIGLAYLYGIDAEIDREKAVTLIEDSANNGYFEALIQLVKMYKNGIGVKQDYAKACNFLEKILHQYYNEIIKENKVYDHDIITNILQGINTLVSYFDNIERDNSKQILIYKKTKKFIRNVLSKSSDITFIYMLYIDVNNRLAVYQNSVEQIKIFKDSLKKTNILLNSIKKGILKDVPYILSSEVITIYIKLSQAYREIGSENKAIDMLNKASELALLKYNSDNNSFEDVNFLINTIFESISILLENDKLDECEILLNNVKPLLLKQVENINYVVENDDSQSRNLSLHVKTQQADYYNYLASINIKNKDYETAKKYLLEVKEIVNLVIENDGDINNYIRKTDNLLNIYFVDYAINNIFNDSLNKEYNDAINDLKIINNSCVEDVLLNENYNFAYNLREINIETSIEYFQKVVGVIKDYESIESKFMLAKSYYFISCCNIKLDNISLAVKFAKQSNTILKNIVKKYNGSKNKYYINKCNDILLSNNESIIKFKTESLHNINDKLLKDNLLYNTNEDECLLLLEEYVKNDGKINWLIKSYSNIVFAIVKINSIINILSNLGKGNFLATKKYLEKQIAEIENVIATTNSYKLKLARLNLMEELAETKTIDKKYNIDIKNAKQDYENIYNEYNILCNESKDYVNAEIEKLVYLSSIYTYFTSCNNSGNEAIINKLISDTNVFMCKFESKDELINYTMNHAYQEERDKFFTHIIMKFANVLCDIADYYKKHNDSKNEQKYFDFILYIYNSYLSTLNEKVNSEEVAFVNNKITELLVNSLHLYRKQKQYDKALQGYDKIIENDKYLPKEFSRDNDSPAIAGKICEEIEDLNKADYYFNISQKRATFNVASGNMMIYYDSIMKSFIFYLNNKVNMIKTTGNGDINQILSDYNKLCDYIKQQQIKSEKAKKLKDFDDRDSYECAVLYVKINLFKQLIDLKKYNDAKQIFEYINEKVFTVEDDEQLINLKAYVGYVYLLIRLAYENYDVKFADNLYATCIEDEKIYGSFYAKYCRCLVDQYLINGNIEKRKQFVDLTITYANKASKKNSDKYEQIFYEFALEESEKLLAINDTDEEILSSLLKCYFAISNFKYIEGDIDSCIDYRKKFLQIYERKQQLSDIEKVNRLILLNNLGNVYFEDNKVDKAKETFNSVVDTNLDFEKDSAKYQFAKAHYNLYKCYNTHGEIVNSKKHLIKAIDIISSVLCDNKKYIKLYVNIVKDLLVFYEKEEDEKKLIEIKNMAINNLNKTGSKLKIVSDFIAEIS